MPDEKPLEGTSPEEGALADADVEGAVGGIAYDNELQGPTPGPGPGAPS